MIFKPVPSYNEEGNSVYLFWTDNGYKLKVVIDELNDDLLLTRLDVDIVETSFCSCKDFNCRKDKPICKHLQGLIDELKSKGVNIRIGGSNE
jgi:predicted nucleic acid-binding Zn finger protein